LLGRVCDSFARQFRVVTLEEHARQNPQTGGSRRAQTDECAPSTSETHSSSEQPAPVRANR
jgi:hypothetical protein